MHTPKNIDSSAIVLCICRRTAINAPVHAPVPGKGMETKIISPKNP